MPEITLAGHPPHRIADFLSSMNQIDGSGIQLAWRTLLSAHGLPTYLTENGFLEAEHLIALGHTGLTVTSKGNLLIAALAGEKRSGLTLTRTQQEDRSALQSIGVVFSDVPVRIAANIFASVDPSTLPAGVRATHPHNRTLAYVREDRVDEKFAENTDTYGYWAAHVDQVYADSVAEIEHARRVLTRLANFGKAPEAESGRRAALRIQLAVAEAEVTRIRGLLAD